MKNHQSWIIRIIVLGLVTATPAVADLTLARIDAQPITLDDLRRAFERQHQGHMTILAEEPVVRDFLESMIRRELFTQEGRRMGMHELPRIRERVALERNRIAGEWLYQSEVEDKVRIKPKKGDAIEAAMERMRSSMQVILIQTDSHDEAESARERVVAGAPAAEVARQVSRARSSVRGGLQGVVWGQTDMPALELAALATEPGGVTPVVAIEEGFCFAKILSRELLELHQPEAARRAAESVLRSRAVDRRRKEYLDALRSRYAASIEASLLDAAILEPLIEAGIDREDDDRVIARFNGGSITLADFVSGIDAAGFAAIRTTQRRLQAQQLLDNQLDAALLRTEGSARWAAAPAEVKARLREVEDDLVFQHLMGSVVFEDLDVSDSEIDEAYAERRDEFVEPPAILLAIALLDTEEEAGRFLVDADSASRFADLAATRSRDPDTAKKGGVAGWVTPDKAIPELRQRAFDLAVDESGGPIRIEAGFLVYRVLERREAFPTPEADARAKVRSSLLKRKSKERMDEWEAKLRAAAAIRVQDSSIRKACRILTKEKEARTAIAGASH